MDLVAKIKRLSISDSVTSGKTKDEKDYVRTSIRLKQARDPLPLATIGDSFEAAAKRMIIILQFSVDAKLVLTDSESNEPSSTSFVHR